ncbi:unnamed protein product [Periconia digitata]|uniref:Uncharacterized protein n=1 Tax=Periconia digitata TaxID=1303443 RepID=A0A9W4XKV2_9PLEO|nr:unnamed protein product [Periconia digitata]
MNQIFDTNLAPRLHLGASARSFLAVSHHRHHHHHHGQLSSINHITYFRLEAVNMSNFEQSSLAFSSKLYPLPHMPWCA